jgi:hypothetical protein
MSQPITWRSMMNISIADADRPLEVAGRLFNSGLDKVAGVLTKHEADVQKSMDREDDVQILGFKEALLNAKDPKEIASLQAGLDARRAAIQNPTKRATLLGLEEKRGLELQDVITKRAAFEQQEQDRKEAPFVLGAKQAIVNGHYEGAKAFLASMSPKAQLEVMQSLDTRQQQEVERARGNLEFSWKGAAEYQKQLLRPGELEGQRLDHAAKRASIAASAEALEGARLQRFTTAQTYLTGLAETAAKESASAIGSPAARSALATQIQAVLKDDQNAIKNATAIVANALEDPKYANLPASVVQTLVMKRIDEVGSGFWGKLLGPNTSFNSTMTSQIKEDLDMALKNPAIEALMNKQNASTDRRQAPGQGLPGNAGSDCRCASSSPRCRSSGCGRW